MTKETWKNISIRESTKRKLDLLKKLKNEGTRKDIESYDDVIGRLMVKK